MRRIIAANEKSVTDLLFSREAKVEAPAGPTIEQERQVEADKVGAFQKREAERKERWSGLMEHATQAARAVEAGDSELIEAQGAKLLHAKLEAMLGKGGVMIEREEVRPTKAHKAKVNDRYAVTDEALMAYHAHILLPSGGTKIAKCVVAYDAAKPVDQQYQVQDTFYDALDQARPFTEDGVKAFLRGEPLKKVAASANGLPEDDKPLVFFNSADDVVGYEDLKVPTKLTAQAVKKLQAAGFEIDMEYLDKTTGVGRQAYIVVAQPDRHDEMRSIVAALVDQWDDKSWFDRATSKEDDNKFGVNSWAGGEDWFDRSLQSRGPRTETVENPHEWPDRALEKPSQEGVASAAYGGTKMLRFERRKAAQAKKTADTRQASRNVRKAKLTAKAGAKAKSAVLDAAQRMERLAKGTRRPF